MATTVKAQTTLPTVEARDLWIADAEAVFAGRPLKAGVNAFVAAEPDLGETVARLKFTLSNDGQANVVARDLIDVSDARGVLPGSFVRAYRDDGTLIAEKFW